jgi:hypothetical protein
MRRCITALAASLALGLAAGVGTAAAEGLPTPSVPVDQVQTGEQTASNEGQESTQQNSATVVNSQGNGNVNAPVQVTLVGDNENEATQGSGNDAPTTVDQSNTSDQTQTNTQDQQADQAGSSGNCCADQSQTGTQDASNEGQTNDQSNTLTVVNAQGNGNVNAPVQVTVIGDNRNEAKQGSYNDAPTHVEQSNDSTQTQSNEQDQDLSQSGSGGDCCKGGEQAQTGEQTASNERQESSQSNSATVVNEQGNGNVNTPVQTSAGGLNGMKSKCGGCGDSSGGNHNDSKQGSGNSAPTHISQSNTSEQTQSNRQNQDLSQSGSGQGCCSSGQSQTGTQDASNEGQTNDQSNSATVVNAQGNGNVNAPVQVTVVGDNRNEAKQGSYNSAPTRISQTNTSDQTQSNRQHQDLSQSGAGGHCCGGGEQTQTGQQTASNERQESTQSNSASVTNQQGNGNLNAPVQTGGRGIWTASKCGGCYSSGGNQNEAKQGSGNSAPTHISQSNTSEQTQSNRQHQDLSQEGSGGCCKPKPCEYKCEPKPQPKPCEYECEPKPQPKPCKHECEPKPQPKPCKHECEPKQQPKQCESKCDPKPCDSKCESYERKPCCDGGGREQTGTQTASNSGQTNQQSNSATITNQQGNGNLSFPLQTSVVGGNSNDVKQGSYNRAPTTIAQSNESRQTQINTQHQSLVQDVRRVCGI